MHPRSELSEDRKGAGRPWLPVALGALGLAASCSLVNVYETVPSGSAGHGASSTVGGSGGAEGGHGGNGLHGGGAGGQTTTTSSSFGGAGGCVPPDDPCGHCGAQNCGELYCGCVTSGECMALVDCLGPCQPTSASCLQACYAQDSNDALLATLIADCLGTSCGSSCAGAHPLAACEKCLLAACTNVIGHCVTDSVCISFLACLNGCTSEACVGGCYDTPAQQNPNSNAVWTCLSESADCTGTCSAPAG